MKTFKELQERLAEAKVEAGRSDYGKASVRNKRKFGKEGEPAVFDASGERGKMIDQRRAEHKAKRGVKEGYKGTADLSKADPAAKKKVEDRIAKHFGTKRVPGGKKGVKEEVVSELNRYGKETGKATGSINKRPGSKLKKGGDEPSALRNVRGMIRRETGKPEGQRKKNKGEKGRQQPGDRRGKPADTIARRRQSRKDADAAMRDTRGT